MCDIETKIIKAIKEIPEDNYIKKWLADTTITKDIIKCIANCTSPVRIEDEEDTIIQEKIKTIFI